MTTQMLNDPNFSPPPGFPTAPGLPLPPGLRPPVDANAGPAEPLSTEQVQAAIKSSTATEAPKMQPAEGPFHVDLPGGYISPKNDLVTTALVRELNGYDEERLSRIDIVKNLGKYVTEMLTLCVEDLGGAKPSKETIRGLLIGDRDSLVLGIRRATYGNTVTFNVTCIECHRPFEGFVELDKDVPLNPMEDRYRREFDVTLKNDGLAKVILLTGIAQEAFSEDIGMRTGAELDSILLAKSVAYINGIPTNGSEDSVRALSAFDRATITKFIGEHQPGPSLNEEVGIPCAHCGAEFPVSLGYFNLFRL